ncbi:MAG: respiratory nitrate reductase subunit gamma [Microbacteriaceae bacterium]|nr:MAG: respiratory nitrate reductase subunit gamma [Microbacteriaceae bacterium]
MTVLNILLWVAIPYAAVGAFVVGHIFRWRYDQFGWTSRSSQGYESKILRWGSPLFHYGILAVFVGHIVGLLVPKEWILFFGVSEEMYHLGATYLGALAAIATIIGMVLLLCRRGAVRRVLRVTTVMDVVMYVFLLAAVIFGTIANMQYQVFGPGYDYRETISPWIRSLGDLQPNVELMVGVPLIFQIHIITAMLLFMIWPFTRLVHVFSIPVLYLFRPYVVYRSRDMRLGARATQRGWARSRRPGTRAERVDNIPSHR